MTAYDPPILMQNPFLHKKWGCLQKNRALAMAMSSFEKENLKISEKLARPKFF